MKKVIVIILAIMVASFGFAGCKPKTGGAIDFGVDFNAKPKLKILMPNAGVSDPAFNSSTPADIIKKYTGYETAYSQMAADSDTATQVAFTNSSDYHAIKLTKSQFDYFVSKDVLQDLTPAFEKPELTGNLKANISQSSWDTVTYNGKILGIPERSASESIDMTIVFRKDKLFEAGINVLPTNIAEFRSTLVKLKDFFSPTVTNYRPFGFARSNAMLAPIASAFGVPYGWDERNGQLEFYAEAPETQEYVEFMAGLKADQLLDETSVSNQSMSDCLAKFSKNQISCTVIGYWNTTDMLSKLQSEKVITGTATEIETRTFDYILDYVPALADSNGKVTKWQSGGIGYVTVIPYYMNKSAAYTIDWLNKKIATDAFREMVIGVEGTNYEIREGQYNPLNFTAFQYASSYITGIDEANYEKYWMARVQKTLEMKRCYDKSMQNWETLGVKNPAVKAPPLLKSSKKITSNVEADFVRDAVCGLAYNGFDKAKYDDAVAKWRANGGTAIKEELNEWWASIK